jgi:hypothetical protein
LAHWSRFRSCSKWFTALNEPKRRCNEADRFAISPGMRLFGTLCHEFPRLWAGVESLESAWLRERLEDIAIEQPIYVTGLARSGTTVLLELLAEPPSVVTHRYRDFPPIWTPFLWNRFLQLVPQREAQPYERPHGDGIEITPESPEAMEEALWMRFFPDSHDPQVSNQLGRAARNDAFANFYRRHIRKLLLVRGGRRYLAKGNYNVARLGYIHEQFPDARFVVPVRHPVSHVASMARQHQIFSSGQQAHAASRAYLRRVGHFEFGLDRAPLNMGDAKAVNAILDRWSAGDEPGGWALYWSHVYGAVRDQLDDDDRLRESVLVVRYEDLNARPFDQLGRVFDHCRLNVRPQKITELSSRLRHREYYASGFGPEEKRKILDAAGSTMLRYGYSTEYSTEGSEDWGR